MSTAETQATTSTPEAPAPGPTLAETIEGFDFDESSGELVASLSEAELGDDPDESGDDEGGEVPNSGSAEETSPKEVDWEARYKELQSHSDKKLAELEKRFEQLASGEKPKEPRAPAPPLAVPSFDELFDGLDDDGMIELVSDRGKAKEFFTKMMRSGLEPIVQKLRPIIEVEEAKAEFAALISDPDVAPDFRAHIPQIKQILSHPKGAGMTFREAYELAKTLSPTTPSPKDSETANETAPESGKTPAPAAAPPKPSTPAPTPDEVRARARRLAAASEAGSAGSVREPAREVTSTQDAFNLALEQVFGGE